MLRSYLRRAYRTLLPIIYSKKQYKFFMINSFEGVERKARQALLATNVLTGVFKPVLVKPPFGKRALVVAPHQDDEAIGCGGAILAHTRAGGRARVVVAQDGGGAQRALGMTREELIETRERESGACAKLMGCPKPDFLRFPHVTAKTAEDVAERLGAILDDYRPDAVFVPFALDNHLEHQYTAKALAMALAERSVKLQVYSYEVWGLCIPNTAVAIDRVVDEKDALINCFASQTSNNDYAHAFRGLAMYHSLQFGAIDTRYVERFFALPADEFVEFVNRVVED